MDSIFFSLVLIAIQGKAASIDILLTGPKFVKIGGHVWITCSSDTVPSRQIAEFLLNDVTYSSIRLHDSGCFSTSSQSICQPDICQCSSDGKTYSVRTKDLHQAGNIEVVCSMKFKLGHSVFKTKQIDIQVLDIIGPNIQTDNGLALIAGKDNRLTCHVKTSLYMELYFRCLNFTSTKKQQFYSGNVRVYIDIHVKSEYNDENCTCTIHYKTFTSSTSIVLKISSPPLLEIEGNNVYNRSSTISLLCLSNEDETTYRFDDWTHTVNGITVRRMKGKRSGKTLSLLIQSCSFKDEGEYTCAAWNENNNQTYWSNKTVAVKVLDAPAVVQASSLDEPILTFSVLYYSKSQARVPKWFAYRQLLTNSTFFTISNDQTNISIDVYGTKIILLGFCTNLSMRNPTSGEITVVLSNDYGVTEHTFQWKSGQSEFQYTIILLVLTGAIVFIMTVGVTSVVVKIKTIQGANDMTQHQRNTTRDVIYYAAPEDENNKNVYDITSSDYVERDDGETSSHYIDVTERYEEIDDNIIGVEQFEESNHYMEIEI